MCGKTENNIGEYGNIFEFIDCFSRKGVSDIHIHEGENIFVRKNGEIIKTDVMVDSYTTDNLVKKIFSQTSSKNEPNLYEKMISEDGFSKGIFSGNAEMDASFSYGDFRYRVNIYRFRNRTGMALRVIKKRISSIEELNLPEILKKTSEIKNGMVIVTGPTGSGKSSTLAAIIDYINTNMKRHIVTIEDPIEYVHVNRQSLITQRELENDTKSYHRALISALRQDPDIILIGELRDSDTAKTALEAAQTGHLVFTTMHTSGAVETVQRIIDMFDYASREFIRSQLGSVLKYVFSQKLQIKADGTSMIPIYELMTANSAVKNIIRDGKVNQLENVISTSSSQGMISEEKCIERMKKLNLIC